jgi:hypothetical protein
VRFFGHEDDSTRKGLRIREQLNSEKDVGVRALNLLINFTNRPGCQSNSAQTIVWSEAPATLRGAMSTSAVWQRAAITPVAIIWSMRQPKFRSKCCRVWPCEGAVGSPEAHEAYSRLEWI